MKTPKNNSAKIIVPLIIIGIGMALLLVLIPGNPETTTDQQVANTEIRDGNQFIPDDEYNLQGEMVLLKSGVFPIDKSRFGNMYDWLLVENIDSVKL